MRVATVVFTIVLGGLTVTYERLVRASEERYGVKRSDVAIPRLPKLQVLARDLAEGNHYNVYAIGTSRTEEGIRSDTIAASLGPTFNIGMGGSSLIAGFDLLDLIDERPALVLAGVSPMDFTVVGMSQGAGSVRRARDAVALLQRPKLEERGPAAVTRDATYALLHGAAPLRKRNLGEWYDRFRFHGDVLKFLNNADAISLQERLWIRGFLGVHEVATAETFTQLRPTTTLSDYVEEHEPIYARLQECVARQRARGTEVVLVRLPLAPIPRRLEDDAGFDRDIRAAASRLGVRYIDGNALMGEPFLHDLRNFADGGHLNLTGATEFSRALAATLNLRHEHRHENERAADRK